MNPKSINRKSTEEIKTALEESTATGYKPTVAIFYFGKWHSSGGCRVALK